jgi:hypothetical protein
MSRTFVVGSSTSTSTIIDSYRLIERSGTFTLSPREHRPSQTLTGVVFTAGDHRSRRFRGSQDDLLVLLEQGQQGEPSDGGVVTNWSPEHRQR